MSVYSESSFRVAYNGFGLGAVERQPVRWENCAKPVLYAAFLLLEKYFLKMFGNSKYGCIFVNEIKNKWKSIQHTFTKTAYLKAFM